MTIVTEKPQEALKLFTFKPDVMTKDPDEMETVVSTSIDKAVEKNPKVKKWIIHSITK